MSVRYRLIAVILTLATGLLAYMPVYCADKTEIQVRGEIAERVYWMWESEEFSKLDAMGNEFLKNRT